MTLSNPNNMHAPDHWSKDPEVAKYDAHTEQAARLARGAINSGLFFLSDSPSTAEPIVSVYDQLAEEIGSSGLSTIAKIELLETAIKMEGQQKRADGSAETNHALAALVMTRPVTAHVANNDWPSVSLIPERPRKSRFSKNK
jgi:hypothetical protein